METQEVYRVPGKDPDELVDRHPDFAVLYLRVDPRLKAGLETMAHEGRQSVNRLANQLLCEGLQRCQAVAEGDLPAAPATPAAVAFEAGAGLECPGHGRGGVGEPCCERAGQYNGFGSGPLLFDCPKSCSCHD